MNKTAAAVSPILGLVAVLLLSCTTRDPLNPLDPSNPNTGGQPEWLEALADHQAVDLRWDVPTFADLQEVQLMAVESDSTLWSGGAGEATLRHENLINGVDQSYRLDLVLNSGRVIALDEVPATPGPAIPWVLDIASGSLARLTPDGRSVRFRVTERNASSIVVDPETGSVLSLNFFSGEVVLRDRDGVETWRREDFFRPSAGAHDRGSWFVTDSGLGVVALLDSAGETLSADSSFTFPVDVTVGGRGDIWVADRAGSITEMNFGKPDKIVVEYDEPIAVARSRDLTVWVADTGTRQLIRQGTNVVLDNLFIVNLTADQANHEVWAADRGEGRVVAFDENGAVVAELSDLPSPSSMSVSPFGVEVWVADPAAGLIRHARDGTRLATTRGVSSPVSVDIAFDPVWP